MLTGLPWRPIITYGSSPTTIALTLPQKLWSYGTQLQGASSVFSAGNIAAYQFREDNRAKLTLRVRDCEEYLDVRAWIMAAMLGGTFTFQFDADDSTSEFTCRLDAPTFKDGFKPRRVADWPDVWEMDVTIRNVAALPIFFSVAQTCDINSTGDAPLQQWVLTNIDYGNGEDYVLALLAPYGSGLGTTDTTIPYPITDTLVHEGDDDALSWLSRFLTAGILIPTVAQVGLVGTDQTVWQRMDATLTIEHRRGALVLASHESTPHAGSFLGGGSYETFDISGIGPLRLKDGDQVRLFMTTFAEKKTIPADDGFRISFGFGSVPGPLTTTRLYAYSNVTELP